MTARKRKPGQEHFEPPREVPPFIIRHFYNLHFRGGPLDGEECRCCQDPGDEVVYIRLDTRTRKNLTSRYLLENSFNFERFYRDDRVTTPLPWDIPPYLAGG